LAHPNLLQLVSHHGTDSVRDLGLLCRNKMHRPVGIMVVNGTHSVFLMPVIPVTFVLILPWCCDLFFAVQRTSTNSAVNRRCCNRTNVISVHSYDAVILTIDQ